ncbi:uncharacterized protein EV154DRAFT_540469 [Mucor mucedo]|uniref:uncharacterized protein n=1 Tax=Mucor mucedo TaxID=29922 RepID=UPI00222073F5|nr:uncharacterized protein EV154DRAFT_540469 [Mucor mucedo]KAI7874265.1 hypothetical protein EV154DRAFT_540469 [Mucor mucedo]
MKGRFVPKQHLTHSTNPYIHKCCGCIHLRMGSALTCLIWAGISLYFAILSFQSRSPFYSFMDPTGLYIFGAINLILFGVSLGTLILIYLRSPMGMKAASFIINCVVFVLVVDMTVNTILFIVRREAYVNWCSQANAKLLHYALFLNDDPDKISEEDLYNCGRTWEDELKFSVLSTIVMIAVYLYLAISIFSYSVKLRFRIKHEIMGRMRGDMMGGMMLPPGPMSTI